MRFAIISLSIYFLLQAVGTALADISDLKFPEFKMRAKPEMHFEYHPDLLHSDQLKRNDPLNVFHCDGYLTNHPAVSFCSKTVPDD